MNKGINTKDWTGNKNSIYKTLGASNHTDKQRENNDFYATDPIAIDKLLQVELLNSNIWECACGEGHLSERLKENHFNVFSTDLINRGYQDKLFDFLKATKENVFFDGTYDIVTNPPYKYAKEFVLKALDVLNEGSKCCMFLKLTFLEGKSRYKQLFSITPPKTIYVFSERILCAKNGMFKEMREAGGSAVCYAWFVWQKGYKKETTIKWL